MLRFQNLRRRNEIGANCYHFEIGETRFVMDTGMHPKEEGTSSLPDFSLLPYDSLDAIVVTHSHLDHVGSLPVLMRQQPDAPVYMTEPTAALAEAMLHNSVNVMTSQRTELGIRDYPLFTHRELDRLKGAWKPRPVGRAFPLGDDGVTATFFDAGHILGSVGVLLKAGERRIFYTGDVHFEDQTIARAADFPREHVDTLIMETTRGSLARAPHYSRASETERFAKEISVALQRGGSVLIPVFAMGKTQEVLVMLDELRRARAIPRAPIFIGGLSTKMTLIYDSFADSARRQHEGFKILEHMDLQVASRRRKRALEYSPGCIYALSSGMMTEKTVSNQFALQFLDNPKNALLFVGYCDPASPGGKIRAAARGDLVTLDPEAPPIELNCDVDVFDFSGHAPREDLLEYAAALAPSKIVLVHGDADALQWFDQELRKALPDADIVIPKPGEFVDLC